MTSKELRELARTTLAKELTADLVNMDRVNAAGMTLNLPNDPDEEREAHRKHIAEMNAAAPVAPIAHIGPSGIAGAMGKQFGS